MASQERGVGARTWGAVKAVVLHAIMPALEKLIPQGSAEVAQALFSADGSGFTPYGPGQQPLEPAGDGVGVHGEASVEEKAAHVIDFQEAKAALGVRMAIDANIAVMTPEERVIAEKFRPSQDWREGLPKKEVSR